MTIRPDRQRAGLLATLVGACLALGACASSGATSTSSSTSPPTTAPATTQVTTTTVGTAGYVVINGKKVAVPDEGTRPVRLTEDVGEQILITPTRIEPHLLFCQVGLRLTFTNLTSVPQQLTFVNDGGWRSPVIAPGDAWHYTPRNALSFYFVTNTKLQATFQASAPIPGNP